MAWRAAAAMTPPFSAPIQQQQQQQQQQQKANEEEAAALSISDHRILYLVNIFMGSTVRFLNSFASLCEDKLSQLHRRILSLDATLSLLEAKLEGTCPYKEFDNNSCQEIKESLSSLPVLTNSAPNNRLLDAPFEHGESSGQVANVQKAYAVTTSSEGSQGKALKQPI